MWVDVLRATAGRVAADLAAAMWVARVTVRAFTVVVAGAGEASLVVASAVVSGAADVVSATAGGASTLTGDGAVVVETGAGSVGCVACASNGVDESARAAAIAGSALVRA